ncbi:hypothetical protein [Ruminococcus sp.]|uniref:hypothetical protein n=1 Tax=Ruminococcus sp. TaxID=41978 RepID=UPI0038905B12
MYHAKINNEVELNYPDSFVEMNEEGLTRHFGTPENRWGAYDEAGHIILSVSWAKSGFLKTLGDADLYLSQAEARLRRRLLNYQRVLSYDTKLGKKKAYAVRFEYRVNDSVNIHVGDLVVFKHKKMYYSIYYITRKKNAASSRPAFQEILQSVTLS